MSRLLVIFVMGLMAPLSAQALNLYSDEDSVINMDAEIRILGVAQDEEVGEAYFTKDDDSRLTLSFQHRGQFAAAVGAVQFRFSDDRDSNNVFAKLLFGGIQTQYGTLLAGRQYTFVDEVDLQDVSYNFGDTIALGSDYDSSMLKYTYGNENLTLGLLITIPSLGMDNSGDTFQALIKTHVDDAELQVILGNDDDDLVNGIYYNSSVGYSIDGLYFGASVNYMKVKEGDDIFTYGVGSKYDFGAVGVYTGYEDTTKENSSAAWYLGSDYYFAKMSVLFAEFGEHANSNGLSLEIGFRTQF